jgi:hypothetical protein
VLQLLLVSRPPQTARVVPRTEIPFAQEMTGKHSVTRYLGGSWSADMRIAVVQLVVTAVPHQITAVRVTAYLVHARRLSPPPTVHVARLGEA